MVEMIIVPFIITTDCIPIPLVLFPITFRLGTVINPYLRFITAMDSKMLVTMTAIFTTIKRVTIIITVILMIVTAIVF